MNDGLLGKCKECTKSDVKKRYRSPDGREKIISYERKRFQNPERTAKVIIYQRERRKRSPEKEQARGMVGKALENGTLIQKPCEVCGSLNSEAHHSDYSKPLDVNWLCFKHHREGRHGQVTS